MNSHHKYLGYLLLRVTLGLVLLLTGVAKFIAGRQAFVAHLEQTFSSSILPNSLVHLFGVLLPFAEVGLGLLVVFGVFTTAALVLLGLLLIALNSGMVIVQESDTVAHNLIYSLIVYVLLGSAGHNGWAVARFWRPASADAKTG